LAALSPSQQTELLTLSKDEPSENDEGGQPLFGFIQAVQPFRVARLLSDGILASSVYPHLSPELQPAYRAGVNRASYMSTISAEARQRQASIEQVRQIGTLGDLPMVLLASSDPPRSTAIRSRPDSRAVYGT
jgi:hypothetical protein